MLVVAMPQVALGFTVYGASGETTRNAYGNWYAGQQKCAGELCHKTIVETPSVHGNMVTSIEASPTALIPAAGTSFWPAFFGSGPTITPADIWMQIGDGIGFLEYAGKPSQTLATLPVPGDMPLWDGLQYIIGSDAWDSSTEIKGTAYSQSCSACHNLGVSRPTKAGTSYTLPGGATQSETTTSGVFGFSIQCEVCHGTGENPGGHRAGIPDVVGGTAILKAQVCGQCHVTGTAPQLNVAGKAFGNPNGYTTDEDLSAYLTPTTKVPTEQEFMDYVNKVPGAPRPAFLPNGDNYSMRHVYYNEWLINKAPSQYGGEHGHADPVNNAVDTYGSLFNHKCFGCHSGLGFLQRIEAKTPSGALIVTDAPTPQQVEADDPGISCQVCHSGHVGYTADKKGYDSVRTWGDGKAVDCADCHNWQFEVLEMPVQFEVVGLERFTRPTANMRSQHPQREMFSGGEGGASGTGGMWGVPQMGEFMPETECIDCHMPRTSKEGMPADDDGSPEATRMSHRFHVTMPGDAARWKLRLGGDSCAQPGCHKESAADYTRTDFQQWIDTIQAGTDAAASETTSALSAVAGDLGLADWAGFFAAQPGSGAAAAMSAAEWKMLQKAAQNADFVINDASHGVHQPRYAGAGLRLASRWARSFGAAVTAAKQPRIDGVEGVRITGSLLGNDGAAIVGAVVQLEQSFDSGVTWTAIQSRTMSGSQFAFNTGAYPGVVKYRVAYTPDAGVTYRSPIVTVAVPVTTIVLTPPAAATEWVGSNVDVVLSSSAADSIIVYSLSGATVKAPTVYTGPFTLTANGVTTVTYWSIGTEATELPKTQDVRIDKAEAGYRTVWRFRNLSSGFYLWSADPAEKDTIVSTLQGTWLLEGQAYRVRTSTNISPLWRFVNIRGGYYLYTADAAEKAAVMANASGTWRYEGPAYNVSTNSAGAPVWRFRNKTNGTYLYSADINERNSIVANLGATWQLEGPAFYVMP